MRQMTRPRSPASIIIACADDGIGFQDLSWTNWTTSSAMGTGRLWKNDCTPDCAGGTFHHYDASVTLTTVVVSINGPVFSVIKASYPNGGPDGKARGKFSLPVPPPPSPVVGVALIPLDAKLEKGDQHLAQVLWATGGYYQLVPLPNWRRVGLEHGRAGRSECGGFAA
jgi:hypothetical protein